MNLLTLVGIIILVYENPFAEAGFCVLVGSAVMVIVSLLTRPMEPGKLDAIFSK